MSVQPNILLITTDQQRWDTIAAAGHPHIRTPHLNWLLESGIHFRRAYTDSPVCVPARATLLTGRHFLSLYPTHGNWGQPTTPAPALTLPALLKQIGYQTKSVGKLHHTPVRESYGWDQAEILEDYYLEMKAHPERGVPMDHGLGQNEMEPGFATVHESHTLTHWITNRAIQFLETRDSSRPFALNVGFSKPHPPFDPCLPYWLMYQNTPMPDPVLGDWSADPDRIAPGLMGPTWQLNGADRFPAHLIREVRRAYCALITQIDYNLGLLFSRLRELGLLENTLILFTADHGEMLGDHHMGAKTTFLEGAAHIPLIVRPPQGPGFERYQGLRANWSGALACLADVAPTCLAAAGLPVPPEARMDGLDLIEIARGRQHRDRLIGCCAAFSAVIEDRWKYIFCEQGGAELLFDLVADPLECQNRAEDPSAAGELERLRGLLSSALERAGHPAAGRGRPRSTQPAPGRAEVRAHSWPGFHHAWHTDHDVLH
jgi:arylsulfatase A-like enzyme